MLWPKGAAAAAGVAVVVLDRPNPLGGLEVEGDLVQPGFESFVGLHPVPVRHGLTIGEMAKWLVGTRGVQCELTVVPMHDWKRSMYWSDTRLAWVPPSPNMPTPDTALVYPGQCLVEGTNLSEARGTTRPFEQCGAPFLDAVRPRIAIFQAGYRNRFGHPAAEVLERYRERGIAVVASPACGAWQWHGDGAAAGACERDVARRYRHHRSEPSPH